MARNQKGFNQGNGLSVKDFRYIQLPYANLPKIRAQNTQIYQKQVRNTDILEEMDIIKILLGGN